MDKIDIAGIFLADNDKKKGDDCLDDNVICAYAAHTLSPEEKKAVEKHFAVCDICRREAIELFDIMTEVEAGEMQEPSENTSNRVKEMMHTILSIRNTQQNRFRPEEEKMICPNYNCKAVNPEDAKFCNHCGISLMFPVPVTCYKCNKAVSEGSVFCNHCGTEIVVKSAKTKEIMDALKQWLPEKIKENGWLVASIAALLVSFAVSAYFIQFCVAAGIFGGMWIFNKAKRDMLIQLYSAWKNKDEERVEILVAELKDKIGDDRKNLSDSLRNSAENLKNKFKK